MLPPMYIFRDVNRSKKYAGWIKKFHLNDCKSCLMRLTVWDKEGIAMRQTILSTLLSTVICYEFETQTPGFLLQTFETNDVVELSEETRSRRFFRIPYGMETFQTRFLFVGCRDVNSEYNSFDIT